MFNRSRDQRGLTARTPSAGLVSSVCMAIAGRKGKHGTPGPQGQKGSSRKEKRQRSSGSKRQHAQISQPTETIHNAGCSTPGEISLVPSEPVPTGMELIKHAGQTSAGPRQDTHVGTPSDAQHAGHPSHQSEQEQLHGNNGQHSRQPPQPGVDADSAMMAAHGQAKTSKASENLMSAGREWTEAAPGLLQVTEDRQAMRDQHMARLDADVPQLQPAGCDQKLQQLPNADQDVPPPLALDSHGSTLQHDSCMNGGPDLMGTEHHGHPSAEPDQLLDVQSALDAAVPGSLRHEAAADNKADDRDRAALEKAKQVAGRVLLADSLSRTAQACGTLHIAASGLICSIKHLRSSVASSNWFMYGCLMIAVRF